MQGSGTGRAVTRRARYGMLASAMVLGLCGCGSSSRVTCDAPACRPSEASPPLAETDSALVLVEIRCNLSNGMLNAVLWNSSDAAVQVHPRRLCGWLLAGLCMRSRAGTGPRVIDVADSVAISAPPELSRPLVIERRTYTVIRENIFERGFRVERADQLSSDVEWTGVEFRDCFTGRASFVKLGEGRRVRVDR